MKLERGVKGVSKISVAKFHGDGDSSEYRGGRFAGGWMLSCQSLPGVKQERINSILKCNKSEHHQTFINPSYVVSSTSGNGASFAVNLAEQEQLHEHNFICGFVALRYPFLHCGISAKTRSSSAFLFGTRFFAPCAESMFSTNAGRRNHRN